ncbi:MAG TPA: hypothetical protein PK047_06925 [Saprospiraceae bacterium]|jgi:hypothetical protein|nr:hypothetical protein [Saprospiraceae bacterium]HRP41970.1 hypothetical protein [Saprospiraceae bacterium]
MLKSIYLALKAKLVQPWWYDPDTPTEDLLRVDWYLGQDLEVGDEHVLNTPVCYIQFLPVPLTTLPSEVQHGLIRFNVILLTETVYGDERDMLHPLIGHQALETAVYRALMNRRTVVDVNGRQVAIHESIVRRQLTPHGSINNLVKSVQTFECVGYDYSAYPEYVDILASLELDAYLVDKIG